MTYARSLAFSVTAHAFCVAVIEVGFVEPEWLSFTAYIVALSFTWIAAGLSSAALARSGAGAAFVIPPLSAAVALLLAVMLFGGSISPHLVAAPAVVLVWTACYFWPSFLGAVVGANRCGRRLVA